MLTLTAMMQCDYLLLLLLSLASSLLPPPYPVSSSFLSFFMLSLSTSRWSSKPTSLFHNQQNGS